MLKGETTKKCLKICRGISNVIYMNFSTSFRYFFISLSVSHNLKNPQMSLERPQIQGKSNFLPKSSIINKINIDFLPKIYRLGFRYMFIVLWVFIICLKVYFWCFYIFSKIVTKKFTKNFIFFKKWSFFSKKHIVLRSSSQDTSVFEIKTNPPMKRLQMTPTFWI